MTPEQIARHEAAHCSMAVTLGVPVRYVGLTATGGFVEYEPHSHTRKGATLRMMIILGGLIETAETGADLPAWPIDPDAGPDAERSDRRLLALLADRLKLSEGEYRQIVLAALKVSLGAGYEQLVTGISGVLDYTPRIGPDVIAALERRL